MTDKELKGNEVQTIMDNLLAATATLRDIGGSSIAVMQCDKDDAPKALTLICLDSEKAAKIKSFYDSLDEEDDG